MMPGSMNTLIGMEGHTKFVRRSTGEKWYRCNLANAMGMRYSRKKFMRAEEAEVYGRRVVERFERMKNGNG